MNMQLKKSLAALSTLAMLASPLLTQAASMFNSGDLIKGSGSTVYYFAPNGKRYVFPNDKTYFTWYKDFSGVKTVSDGVLATIPLGGNVTYRPGYKMVKITTDPRTYVVDQGGVLRHVTSEQLAQTMYGLNWNNRIDDIPDAFFVNYRVGTAIQTASDYQPDNILTQTVRIAQDKQFDETKMTVTIGNVNNGFVPSTLTVKKGTTITWTNSDITSHDVTGTGWSSSNLAPNATYSKTFDTVGYFDYKDSQHTVMQGTINVVN